MASSTTIGIIGYGVVGKAIEYTLSSKYSIKKFDIIKKYDAFSDICNSDFVFISVPTPFDSSDQKVDLSSVEVSLDELSLNGYKGIVIIKSTVPPGTTDYLLEKSSLKLCFNPEFLRESVSANDDFENQDLVILGTNNSNIFEDVKAMYSQVLKQNSRYVQVSPTTAEMIKYSQNATLASRVAIANIIFDACEKFDVDYSVVKSLGFDSFEILGPYMVEVPGPDGKRGFGGKCLPKDISGFNSVIESDILSSIITYNKTLRDDLD